MSLMPISKAILYKTGIGYFERSGKIDLSKTNKVLLSFKKKLMNDVLSSLSVSGQNALVTGVSYEGHDIDLTRALEDCLIKVPENDSFLALMKQIIGVEIEIILRSETIKGTVLGIQEFERGVEESEQKIMEPFLVLSDENGNIKNIKVEEIAGPNAQFSINDEKMNKELQYFLETIYTSKKRDAKTMTIFLEGKADSSRESEVSISYLHEIPSWKASYRLLVFPTETILQGFGIIDNPTDEDWDNIKLLLVAGLPISFIYDLYSPNWIKRPSVARRTVLDIKPAQYEEATTYDGLFANLDDNTPAKKSSEALAGLRRPTSTVPITGNSKEMDQKTMEKVIQSTKIGASGAEAGDFFQYQITVPITVKRNQSSLVPISQSKVTANRMSVYNENIRKDNPMLTIELTNDTGLTLEEGPISVFEMGTYAGEAMLPFLKKDEKRRIGYAVDLGVFVTKTLKEDILNFHEIQIEKNIHASQYLIKKEEYTIKNKSGEQKEIVIEHTKMENYKLFETPEPFEESKNFYRYKVTIAPKSTEKLQIQTRSIISQYRQYVQVSKYDIEEWYRLKLIDDTQKDYLMKIWKAVTELQDIRTKIQSLQNDKNNISYDQNRLRENIKVMGKGRSELKLRDLYVKKLETQEEILEKIDKEIEILNKKVENFEYLINALNKLDYKDATSLNNVGWGFWKIGETELVVEYARKALELDNTKGFIWDTLACGLYKTGNIKESYEAFQKAIALDPKGEEGITQEIYKQVKQKYQP